MHTMRSRARSCQGFVVCCVDGGHFNGARAHFMGGRVGDCEDPWLWRHRGLVGVWSWFLRGGGQSMDAKCALAEGER